jgi:pimeloyl-ACP methyl ester carboxylesterase
VEKFYAWTTATAIRRTCCHRDQLLDNVMLYWLPGRGRRRRPASTGRASATRSLEPVAVPGGRLDLPQGDRAATPRWVAARYTDLRYWNVLDKGGHFAAFEQPALFVDEVRGASSARALRSRPGR